MMKSFNKLVVNHFAVEHNIKIVQKNLPLNKKIIAVIKADAYSHGTLLIANTLLKNGINQFAVASVLEAYSLLPILEHCKVLILSYPSDVDWCVQNHVSVTVSSIDELKQVQTIAKKQNAKANIHLKINSGMNRYGCKDKKEIEDIFFACLTMKEICLEGVFTHFCSAKSNRVVAKSQASFFVSCLKLLPPSLQPIVHIGGYETIDLIEKNHLSDLLIMTDAFRVGLPLYGYGMKKLKPALTLQSQIVCLQHCNQGEVVGYGGKNQLATASTIAVVPFGYADGMPRSLGNGAVAVSVNHQMCKTIGNICMDSFLIDVTNREANIGDKVLVFDNASAWAKSANTIEYEILTNLKSLRVEHIEQL